jgi:Tfp pilus assembly protein PilV
MAKPKIFQQDGITILEVLIAMIILGLSLLVLLNMAMVALDGNDWSNHTTNAVQTMQDKIEELRSSAVYADGEDEVDGVTRTWTVTDVSAHLKRIDVDVAWADVRGRQKTNSMTAFVRVE